MEENLNRELENIGDNSVVEIILEGSVTINEYENRKAITEEKLAAILNAARLSPSACNGQPYHLTVCRGDAARAVANGSCERGIVICTTGIGISIAANKVKGIRCAHCADCLQAEMTRRHNNANVLAMGAGMIGPNMAERLVDTFLTTEFEGGRHQRRIDKIHEQEVR